MMLYIKFEIHDPPKFEDFQKLYDHMVKVRQAGFKFDDKGPEFDWDTMSEEEIDVAMEELNAFLDQQVEPEKHRCKELMPNYVTVFLESYLQSDSENLESFGSYDVFSIFNYLEFGFEVDMESLKKINEHLGIVAFSTGNYPFGGMERFLMTLAAYNLKPVACFDGFHECELIWRSRFDYESVILLKKQNGLQKIKKLIRSSFFKKFLFSLLIVISNTVVAQIRNPQFKANTIKDVLVLEKPEFSSPEKDILFFFSETYLFDLRNYSMDVKELTFVHTVYTPDETRISVDTLRFKYENHFIKNPLISKKPILDYIGIDSISKKGKTVKLFHFDEDLDYIYQVYELKNEQIISLADNTSVKYYNTKYTYNNKRQLLEAETIDDYGIRELITATYNENNTISSKKRFETSDGVTITTTNYSYKNDLLTKVERRSVLYFVPLDQVKTPLEKIDYSKYTNSDTFINLNTVNLTYNEKSELIKIVDTNKGFSENEGVDYEDMELFILQQKPKKLIIHAGLPKKRTYEYIFDDLGHPKEINSYVVEAHKTWLHKKTAFKILFSE
ncbi:hypothetical protein [Bizionia arctica]|uniref:Uncharacterized protein n=1 Tax=Bizionia arctica TaxID=1495645 RepID=A0A917LMU0_9FLAO|nr:hypothetical protein [Bizionia arctica]GGG45031.1 hypothetical protein GCM10010976_15790 [Bizionia arctica]